jgi:uncharacterized protein (UPF0548 family)
MHVTRLEPAEVERLIAEPFTYPAVGIPPGSAPAGYATLSRSADLGSIDFTDAAKALMSWQVQLRSGIRVAASSPTAQMGSVVVLRLGIGPFAVCAPCRVVCVVDEPHRKGFGYGTLPGHPESGEESFMLDQADDGHVTFTVTAFSRPASRLAKLTAPAARSVQHAITRRYLRALKLH